MPSRTTLAATTAALIALAAPMAFAAPVPKPAAAQAAAWDTDRAAAAHAADPNSVTASGSENAASGPGAAADGDGTTRWSSNFADDAWIRVDPGSSIPVSSVTLDWDAAYGKKYVLEVSRNGTDWTTFYAEDDGTGGSVTAHTYPQEVTGRYVRMRGIQRATPWGYSLY